MREFKHCHFVSILSLHCLPCRPAGISRCPRLFNLLPSIFISSSLLLLLRTSSFHFSACLSFFYTIHFLTFLSLLRVFLLLFSLHFLPLSSLPFYAGLPLLSITLLSLSPHAFPSIPYVIILFLSLSLLFLPSLPNLFPVSFLIFS